MKRGKQDIPFSRNMRKRILAADFAFLPQCRKKKSFYGQKSTATRKDRFVRAKNISILPATGYNMIGLLFRKGVSANGAL
ncbi:MAG: hypothetical protein IJ233_01550 [Pyramidobacter sp.]|nr:hypothetical protein [Pyramidobacter sp.]